MFEENMIISKKRNFFGQTLWLFGFFSQFFKTNFTTGVFFCKFCLIFKNAVKALLIILNLHLLASFIGLKVLGFGKLTNVVDIPYVSQASKRGSNK